jgi:hypothetical protein
VDCRDAVQTTQFLLGPWAKRWYPIRSSLSLSLILRIIEAPNLMNTAERSFFSMKKKQNLLSHAVVVLFHIYEVIPGPLDSPTKSPSPNTALMPPKVQAGGAPTSRSNSL